jgi:arylsulfatase
MPLLRGGSRRRGPIFWEHEGNRALRDGRWKIVSDWPGRWELYDLEAGRTELRDLAASEPQRLAEMRTTYERLAAETHVGVWPWVVPQVRWLAWGVLGLVLAAVALGLRRRRHRKAQG